MKPEYKLYFGDNKTGDKSSRRRRGIYTLCNFHFQHFSPCCVVLSVQEAQGSWAKLMHHVVFNFAPKLEAKLGAFPQKPH